MDIVMVRNTLWQNIMVRIGEQFTVSDSIGTALVRRGVAKDKNMVAASTPIMPEKSKKKAKEV